MGSKSKFTSGKKFLENKITLTFYYFLENDDINAKTYNDNIEVLLLINFILIKIPFEVVKLGYKKHSL